MGHQTLRPYIDKITQGSVLSKKDAVTAFGMMMQGKVSDPDMQQFLVLLADRGEAISEITGAAKVLRDNLRPISAPPGTIDCCGTGGDGLHTYNISTAVALIVAACGVPVAKHGNRAASSKSGAADVLEALGVNLDAPKEKLEHALATIGFCFLMAPNHHPAMKHVSAVRKALGRRTIFNLLGPLANPAGVKRQLLGVSYKQLLRPMADVLKNLGAEKAWIVHGADGMDEISLSGPTHVVRLENGQITEITLTPEDFGFDPAPIEVIKGGDAQTNAGALRDLLSGARGPYHDIVVMNAAGALVMAEKAPTLQDAVQIATHNLNNGNVMRLLDDYIQAVS